MAKPDRQTHTHTLNSWTLQFRDWIGLVAQCSENTILTTGKTKSKTKNGI